VSYLTAVDVAARDVMRWVNDYYLWGIGALTATLGLYLLLRQSFPKVAVVIAVPCRAAWWCCGLVVRIPRWLWRQAWLQRDDTGAEPVWSYRGPIERWRAPRRAARHNELVAIVVQVVDDLVTPQFAATRAAALEQHTEQNTALAEQRTALADVQTRLGRIEQYQVDDASRWRDKIEGRVRDLEEVATLPTKPGRKAATTKETDR